MPPEKTPPREATEQQDQSIKARKHQLFESPDPNDGVVRRPFAVYLQTTPAAPMAPAMKFALWAAAAVVALLFLAALFAPRRTPPRRRARAASAAPAARDGWPGRLPQEAFRA